MAELLDETFAFRTSEAVARKDKPNTLKILHKAIKIYDVRGLQVHEIIGDGAFECIRQEVRPRILSRD